MASRGQVSCQCPSPGSPAIPAAADGRTSVGLGGAHLLDLDGF